LREGGRGISGGTSRINSGVGVVGSQGG